MKHEERWLRELQRWRAEFRAFRQQIAIIAGDVPRTVPDDLLYRDLLDDIEKRCSRRLEAIDNADQADSTHSKLFVIEPEDGRVVIRRVDGPRYALDELVLRPLPNADGTQIWPSVTACLESLNRVDIFPLWDRELGIYTFYR